MPSYWNILGPCMCLLIIAVVILGPFAYIFQEDWLDFKYACMDFWRGDLPNIVAAYRNGLNAAGSMGVRLFNRTPSRIALTTVFLVPSLLSAIALACR